jgi:hypothetical protein
MTKEEKEEKEELLNAAQDWRNAAFNEPVEKCSRFQEFMNTARELEQQAETGGVIHINKRIKTK